MHFSHVNNLRIIRDTYTNKFCTTNPKVVIIPIFFQSVKTERWKVNTEKIESPNPQLRKKKKTKFHHAVYSWKLPV